MLKKCKSKCIIYINSYQVSDSWIPVQSGNVIKFENDGVFFWVGGGEGGGVMTIKNKKNNVIFIFKSVSYCS